MPSTRASSPEICTPQSSRTTSDSFETADETIPRSQNRSRHGAQAGSSGSLNQELVDAEAVTEGLERTSLSSRRCIPRTNKLYDVRNEKPPDDCFNNSPFQEAFRGAKLIMDDLAAVLNSGSHQFEPDSTMKRLHKNAQDLARFQCPSSWIVGFVGASGVGQLHHKAN